MTAEQNQPVSPRIDPQIDTQTNFQADSHMDQTNQMDQMDQADFQPDQTDLASASSLNGPASGQATAQQRRRRRRRKANKGFAQAPPLPSGQAGPAAMAPDAPLETPPAAPVPPVQNGHHKQHSQKKARPQGGLQNGNGFQNGGGQRENSQPRNFQKNGANGSGSVGGQQQGARRKNKQRRPAPTFVGPMDHSYRSVNGNVADGSTNDYRSNYRSDRDLPNGNVAARNPYLDPMEAPAVLREDAPTRILCFIEDLFVVAKLQETAKKLGVKVGFLKAEKDTVTRLTDTPEHERPSLIVFDLNNANAKPLVLIPKLKAKLKRGTSVIGFLSHIQGDLKVKAIEAGCDMVMPKSAFSQNRPNLLRRHGLEEELEAVEA